MQKTAKKKQLIFEKGEHFENGQKWPQCKGLLKKRLEKTSNIRKMRAF